jgi:SHS2 domain-containing protein
MVPDGRGRTSSAAWPARTTCPGHEAEHRARRSQDLDAAARACSASRMRAAVDEIETGHRTVPHMADLRVEAWAPTREECIAQAVLGTVESFLDTSSAHPARTHVCRLVGHSDEDLLVAVLDEVIYLLDTEDEAPVDLEVEPVEAGVDVRFAMCDTTDLAQTGAVPKAVSLHELCLAPGPRGWRCSVTVDV